MEMLRLTLYLPQLTFLYARHELPPQGGAVGAHMMLHGARSDWPHFSRYRHKMPRAKPCPAASQTQVYQEEACVK